MLKCTWFWDTKISFTICGWTGKAIAMEGKGVLRWLNTNSARVWELISAWRMFLWTTDVNMCQWPGSWLSDFLWSPNMIFHCHPWAVATGFRTANQRHLFNQLDWNLSTSHFKTSRAYTFLDNASWYRTIARCHTAGDEVFLHFFRSYVYSWGGLATVGPLLVSWLGSHQNLNCE